MPSTSGFMLGVIGGILDFASATSLLLAPPAQSSMMGAGSSYTEAAIGLYLLGVLVIGSTLLSAMMIGVRYPRLFSALMIVYGLVMAVVGWIMLGIMASAAVSSIYSYGMVVVGFLMVANGALMLRSPVQM